MSKTFLMCRPDYFDVNYNINVHMTDQIGKVDVKLAKHQWNALYDQVSALAEVELIDPISGLPDMVFTANGGLPLADTQHVIVSNFANTERQPETIAFNVWFGTHHYNTTIPIKAEYFEGAGDALFDVNRTLWLAKGFRTNDAGVRSVIEILDYSTPVNCLQLVDPRFYHLDTCFCPLDNGYYLAFPGAIKENLKEILGDKLIQVSEEDAVKFACNAISIGDVVILPKCSDTLCTQLAEVGLSTIRMDMSEFLKSGGACKCLVLQLD